MALALYRKYRPATFAEVVGQEHVTGPLMTAVDSGRINHAYLFSGPRGCGKTSSARILARSLNCEQGPTSTPCGVCQSCIDLAPDGSGNIDVIEIDAASHGGVDDARELRERAFQLPVHSRYKIYIIDEAHMVSNQGFNALLKVVEEPPESVIFIFATTEPDKVLPTIRSRTHHYPFRLVPPAAMRHLLERNCQSEGVEVGPAVLPLVVRAGGGSVRDSQSLLDQLIAGAGPDGITYEEALALLGVTDAALLDDMVEAVGVGDGATVFGTVNRLIDAGHDPRRFGADLLDRLRDLILMAAVPDAGQKGLIDAPVDHIERLADQASRLGLSTLSRLADIVHVGLTEMRGTTAPRLGLELICARMLLPAVGDDGASMIQRIERLERRMEIGGLPAADGSAGGPGPGPGRRGGPDAGARGSDGPPDAAAGTSRRPGAADGLTPRQRAEAELAAQRASQGRPDNSAPQQRPDNLAAQQQPGDAAAQQQPGDAAVQERPANDAPQQGPSGAEGLPRLDGAEDDQRPVTSEGRREPLEQAAARPASGTEERHVAESESGTSGAERAAATPADVSMTGSAGAPAAASPTARPDAGRSTAPAPSTRQVHGADSGWPEVKAPGSGRGNPSPASAAAGRASASPEPAAPDEPTTSPNASDANLPTARATISDASHEDAAAARHPNLGATAASDAGSNARQAAASSSSAERPQSVQPADSGRPAEPAQRPEPVRGPVAAEPSRPAAATSAPASRTTPQEASSSFDIAEVRRQWRSVVDLIKRTSRATAALVETATPVVVRGDTLVLTAPPALVRRLSDPQQHQPLKAALQDVLGVSWAIEVADSAAAAGGGAGRAEEPVRDEEDFAPDPYDESVVDPRAGLDPGQAAVNLLRDELGAEEIVEQ